jgi:hypothetical protein
MGLVTTQVFIAGIGNSGPEHWQAIWHSRVPNSVWVEHRSWGTPERDAWVRDLGDALAAIKGPKLLIAHSLGCTLVTEWAAEQADGEIAGALLVAMPNAEGPGFPAAAVGFGTPPRARLPFPAVVVASADDPYGSLEHSSAAAGYLGARLVNVGCKGHINEHSGLGDWPEGWALLSEAFPQ